ncbi:MAG TPA: serine/threonine-protein kinase, partial [Kofleriaceae bacterium]|nr:serine/threonine-protein kinase [Kofleriaceae bacterium]
AVGGTLPSVTRYELLERIGAGRMAEIFRAKAVAAGGFEKPVAIKRILPHLSQDPRFVKLLIAEAKILSQLRHRNVVQIFDMGLGEDGHYFLVMEFVEGTDLGALYGRLEAAHKRLPLDLSLHIGAEVCEALDHAHHARGADGEPLNIVHRDVSPGNVLLSRAGEVKLGDFGIAKHAEGEQTGHGGVRGKFAYISPEQAANTRVDARSDVYAAGVVVTELVTGRRLLSGKPDFDALKAVRENRLPRPRDLDPEMAPELEEILCTAMARNPAERHASAAKLGHALRSYRYSLSSSADPAKELARVISRYAPTPERSSVEREPTVVRIHTAAGFTVSGLDTFTGSGELYDEDEQTHALVPHHLVSTPPQPLTPATPSPPLLFEDPALRQVRADSSADTPPRPTATAPASAAVIAARIPERAATPTVRDLFATGEMVDTQPRERVATPSRPPQRRLLSDGEQLQRPRRRRIVLLVAVAFVLAVASFLVAGKLLRHDDSAAAAPATDASPAISDAGAPDAAKKPKPKPKPRGKKPKPRKPPSK